MHQPDPTPVRPPTAVSPSMAREPQTIVDIFAEVELQRLADAAGITMRNLQNISPQLFAPIGNEPLPVR
jgi:hypothetical protein